MTAIPIGSPIRHGRASARHRRESRPGRLLKELVLSAAGLIGLIAIAWTLCATLFGLSIVVFKTGSMSPTIPTGSAALVRQIPASEIAIGDVITVQREAAALPVTHRVVAIASDPQDSARRLVTLKGDANQTVDAQPYSITQARVVIGSLPGAGIALGVMRSPYFLAMTGLVVALVTVWAFWPQVPAHRAPSPGDEEL